MTTMTDTLWQTKVAARLHDPAEKALVLLRDPAGHENGTSRALTRLLGLHAFDADAIDADSDDVLAGTVFKQGIPVGMYRHVQHADWWAAAADRPQWPMEEISVTTRKGQERTFRVAPWAQVRWTSKPILIHPLTGDQYDLGQYGGLSDTDFQDIKQRNFDHVSGLLARLDRQDGGQQDWRKILLALWRFGSDLREEEDNGKLGALWKLLPADTRIPDHSIWDHLDLTSAFAGGFAADSAGEVALLTLAIGPVQSFIAAARKMEDLWSGSHLLARLSWEAMKVVCEKLGPDAILFPRLRGIPQVDLWLRDECGLPADLFEGCEWTQGGTDSNPLFVAALPNRFVAVVPANQARAIAEQVQTAVRDWLQRKGLEVLQRLLDEAGLSADGELYCHGQMREQLAGFPEVHWAAVPFSLIRAGNMERQTDLDTVQLSEAMRPFFGADDGEPGFLGQAAWKLLQKDLNLTDAQGRKSTFFAPNPGVLYPAVHELAERALAAAKTVRPFAQKAQQGWRCTLTGETEWLTVDAAQLSLPAGRRQDTLWTKVANTRPAWAKKGEHLGALAAIKRLWPTLFAEEVGRALSNRTIGRFVVSTHTMALAHQIDQWLERGGGPMARDMQGDLDKVDSVALPRRLMRHERINPEALTVARRLPALLDMADQSGRESDQKRVDTLVRQTLAQGRAGNRNCEQGSQQDVRLETYYGLLLMDGDRMGAWLTGGDDYAISYRESFHPQVQQGFDEHAAGQPPVRAYGQQKRALSPNRHLAVSGALNDFSLAVVRHVVENEHLGRLIYAGGDDVFAMLPVADLLSAMQRLRYAYSGHDPEHEGGLDPQGLTLNKGFAFLRPGNGKAGKLMRMMGGHATASCGAVIAHHQAPLAAVRRELAAAEQRAKEEGGRDAFSITIVKRSGGALRLTSKWAIRASQEGSIIERPPALLNDLRCFLAHPGVSRRAAYHTLQWLDERQLPAIDSDTEDMLHTLLAYQLQRQSDCSAQEQHQPDRLARRLVALSLQQHPGQPGKRINWMRSFISVAEFLAREVRSTTSAEGSEP